MDIGSLFDSKASHLFWRAINPAQTPNAPASSVIAPGQAYFTVRLCEMYLASARKLWRQIYPLMHCYTKYGSADVQTVVSPTDFQQLGNVNLDRIVDVNVLLSGPNPYHGEEVTVMAGLYAVPGEDITKALVDVVAGFSALDPMTFTDAIAFTDLIKSSVESILGLDQSELHLGIRDTFNPQTHPLASGYYAGIGAPQDQVDASRLWVLENRLHAGKDAASAVSYSDHDYMLIAIEQSAARDDWQQLYELQDFQLKFSNLISDSQFTVSEKRARLAALWPGYVQTLANSPHLVEPDRTRVASLTANDLLRKLKLQDDANPFLASISLS